MRKTLTDRQISRIKPTDKRQRLSDPELAGHYVNINPSGVSFVVVCRGRDGKQIWTTLPAHSIDDARRMAREVKQRVKQGLPAFEAPPVKPDTFYDISNQWLKEQVDERGLISAREYRRILDVYILPTWKDRPFAEIRKRDVFDLLGTIGRGKRQAHVVQGIIKSIMRWRADHDDDYLAPVFRNLTNYRPSEHARERILSDDEIRAVWAGCRGQHGCIIKLLLLTAQREGKVASMKWEDIDGDVWHVPAEARQKGTGGALCLPPIALEIIREQPKLATNPHVFSARSGKGHFCGWSQSKLRLDAASGVTNWKLHDLRRTSRSLMSRAGVTPHIAERVLGHVQPGVAGIYDRHSYRDEKAAALLRLAELIDRIINPPADNVIAINR